MEASARGRRLTHDDIAERWFTLPNLYYFAGACAGVGFSVWLWRSVKTRIPCASIYSR